MKNQQSLGLDAKPRPVASWPDVAARSVERCTRLTFRIHFSWPMTNSDPVYVLYVGPKLTKK